MNLIYRVCWNRSLARWVVTSELARRTTRGRSEMRCIGARRPTLSLLGIGLSLVSSAAAWAGPSGGQITSGTGQITQSSSTTTIQQSSSTLSLNWQSFDVSSGETVSFVQPGARSIAVNHILGSSASQIFGHLNANGQVWLINPNGVLFGASAQVNVGGMVASTLDLVDDGSTTSRRFRGDGTGSVVNQGAITADSGGYVALLAHQVSNQGLISAQLGTVALGAGRAQTLSFNGNHLLHLQVDQSALDDLVENRQLIQANGGQVLMTAGAKKSLLASVVNNTGIVQAQTVQSHNGTISLLAGEQAGTVNVGGTLDASAPHGGAGGTIETSAAHVNIGASAKVSASASSGRAGTWLVDPTDLTIDNAAATAIEGTLNGGTSVTEQTTASGASGQGQTSAGQGDINVNAPITWTNAAASLTLSAYHGINVNAPVSGAGQVAMTAGGGDLAIAASSSVTGQGGVTLSTAGNFVNNAGAAAVAAGSGTQWLVYSTDPTQDTPGGLTPGFIQYNAPSGTTPAQANSSGFLYSVAPTVTVTSLSGTVSKVYDGTTSAALSGSNLNTTGLLNGDVVASASGSYASADAGSGIAVTSPGTASALTFINSGGIPVYGYGLTTGTVNAAIGTISPAPLTATIVGTPTKVYDGTTTATLSSSNYLLSGFVSTQGATVKQPSSLSYASADAGSSTIAATFSPTNFTANAGTNFADYILPTSASGAGLITQAPVSLTGVLGNNKVYDGTTSAALNTTNAGIFGVIAPDAGNVSLSTAAATGSFASANVGNNIGVSLGGFSLAGAKAGDYQLVPPSNLTANITAKGLSVTGVTTSNKVYDGTTTDALTFSAAQLSGVVAGDSGNVSLISSGGTGNFASANAGNNIGVTVGGLSITGSAASNYSLAQPSGLTASISQAPLTISLTGNPTKTYNGSTTAVVANADFSISGLVAGQSVAVAQNASAQYATANAASNIGVTVALEPSDFTVGSGTSLSNYSFSRTVVGTGTINPAVLAGSITNNPTKTYDGTVTATVSGSDYVLSGFVGSQSITVNQPTATYASANAGPELVTANLQAGNFTAGGGTLLSNYVLPASLSGWGTIQPAQLTGNYINGSIVGNPTKTYDGTTAAILGPSNFQLTGFAGSDGATVTQTVGQYSAANVGSQAVTAHLSAGDFSPAGSTTLANYTLPTVVYGTGTINPAVLTVSIAGNPTKVYDGTTIGVLTPSNYSITGFASGEGASIDPSSLINYASKNVGTNIPITAVLTPSAYTPGSGTQLSNYVLAISASGTGQINPAALYVTGVAAQNKVYDTTTAATLNISSAGLAGLVSGESSVVTLNTTTSAAFSQADVGNSLGVTTTGFSISGSGASNYALQPVTGLHANITPAPLTVSGVTANNKPYDGTKSATLDASAASLNGILGSDSVTLSSSGATGLFPTSNVGTGLGVTASGFTLSGGKASDYSVSQPTGLTANIAPEPITVTITGNPTKAYDGSNSATLTASDYTLSGFAPGQSATLPQSATANYLSANAGVNVGLQSSLVISDYVAGSGTNLANYTLPSSATGALGAITPKVLNLSGTRVYDAATDADGSLFGTLTGLNGDLLTVNGGGTLASKNIGTRGFASLGSLSLSASAGNSALESNYTLVGGSDSVRITPAPLTVTGAQAADKVYDGSTAATVSGAALSGVLGSDSVQLGNTTSGTFTDKNAGAGKSVSTVMTVSGTDASNYTLTQPIGVSASITPLAITVSATGANKSYDGNVNDAAVLSSTGVIAGDSVAFRDASATFADPNVGNGKSVSVAGIAATGTDAGNYALNNTTASTAANITPAVINLIGTRVYDAATDADAGLFIGGGTIAGVNGETLTLTGSGTLTSKNVNSAQTFASLSTLALGDGTGLAGNYSLLGGADSVNITPAPLTVTGTAAASRPYNGTTVASLSGAQLAGVLASDDVQLGNDTTGTFASKNVGTNIAVSAAMTVSGADAGNYALTQPAGLAANITQTAITVTATGVNRAYNGGLNDAATLSSSGVVAGDSITFHDTSATFADPNTGTGKTVSVAGISATGTDAGNYQINNVTATTTANITPAVINLSGTRVYDGATDANASLFTTGGVLSGANGETLTLTGSGILSSKNVSASQTFSSLSTLTLGAGTGLVSNYTLSGGTDRVNVTKLPILVSATGANKVYDGSTADPGATLASAGVLAGDSLTFMGTATFAGKNVNTGTSVTVTGISASGTGSGNYSYNPSATTSANITPKPITVAATGTNLVYNGGVADAVSLASSGIVSGDTVTYADSAATFADPNVGNGKTVSVSGIALGGASAGNYSWNTGTTTTANITPKPITVTATGTDIVYNGGVVDPVALSATGIVAGDTLTFSDTSAAFANKNVGNGKTVAVNGITAGGSDPGNYSINTTATTTANITPAPLTVTGTTAADRPYNGTTVATLSGATLSGVLGSDAVALGNSGVGTFATQNAGNNIPVGATMTIGGADAGNYLLTQPTGVAANIAPVVLNLTGTRVYDAGTDAAASLFGNSGLLTGVNSETLTLGGSGTLSSKNINPAQTFASLSGFSLAGNGGALASNYTLNGGADSVNITPAPLTVTGTVAAGKSYDGTAAAALSGAALSGVLGSDAVTLGNGSAGTFATQNAGNSISVGTAMTITGADAGNYTLSQPSGIAANITPKVLNLTGTRVYDDNTDAAASLFGSGGSLAGVNGETLTLSGNGTLSSKNVNPVQTFASLSGFSLAGNGGALAGNYTLSGGADSVNITPAALTVTGTIAAGKTYDGSTAATLSGATLSGVLGSDEVRVGNSSVGTFATPNAGNNIPVGTAMSIAGSDAGNYALSQPTGVVANITPAALNLTGTRVYDADTDAAASLFGNNGVLAGVNGETLTLGGGGTLSGKNVNPAQTFASLSGFSFTGNGSALAANYTLNGGTDSVSITPASLTVAGTVAASKTYDGSTAAALSGATLTGVLGSDAVALGNGVAGSFATQNAGNNIPVGTAMTIAGADAANYTLTQPMGVVANITPAVLNLAGTRVYDAGTDAAAALFGNGGMLAGVNGETLTLSGSGTLSSKNVNPAQTFGSLSGFSLAGSGGALASNYTLSGGSDSVNITPAPLTVAGMTAASKTYDGTTAATLSGAALSGVLGDDDVRLGNGGAGTFATENAGNNISVSTAMTIAGSDAGNYALSQPTGVAANITPAVLSLASTRVYDAGTDAAAGLFGDHGVLTGVNGETLTLSGAGTLSSKNVNPAQTFASLSGFSLAGNGGTLAGNYTLSGGSDSVSITPAPLTVTGTVAASKTYDGNTAAGLSGARLSGVLGSDSVALSNDTTGSFNTKNVGTDKAVSSAMAISGEDAGNYALSQPAASTASISPKPITVAATGENKVYDGSAADRTSLQESGVINGDSVAFTSTAANFATPTVGNGKTVTVSGIALSGSDAGNYTLSNDTATTTADITPASGIQQTAVAVGYLELTPIAIATPYGVAPSESPGQLTGNEKLKHNPVERNGKRADFISGLSLRIVGAGVRGPTEAP